MIYISGRQCLLSLRTGRTCLFSHGPSTTGKQGRTNMLLKRVTPLLKYYLQTALPLEAYWGHLRRHGVEFDTLMFLYGNTMCFKEQMFKSGINLKRKITKPFTCIFIFCNMTDRPSDQVNYLLDPHWHRESSRKKISRLS